MVDGLSNECIRHYIFPSQAKEATKKINNAWSQVRMAPKVIICQTYSWQRTLWCDFLCLTSSDVELFSNWNGDFIQWYKHACSRGTSEIPLTPEDSICSAPITKTRILTDKQFRNIIHWTFIFGSLQGLRIIMLI